jgi:arabinogalactan oligomer/maltooligosaccharide transport system permease protein
MEKKPVKVIGKILASILTFGVFYLVWMKTVVSRTHLLLGNESISIRRRRAKWTFLAALFVPMYLPIWYMRADQQLGEKMQEMGFPKSDRAVLKLVLTALPEIAFIFVILLVRPLNVLLLLGMILVTAALHSVVAALCEHEFEYAYQGLLPKLEYGIFIQEDKTGLFLRRLTVLKVVLGALAYAWLLLMTVIVLTPVIWMVSASFTNGTQLAQVPIIPNFSQWSFVNYIDLFTYTSTTAAGAIPDYIKAFLTTLSIASLNMVLVVVFSSLVGFSFSRYKFKGKKQVLLSMMALQMFPSFMGMLALFMFFRQFGLLNKPFALTLIYTAGSIPYNTFVVRGFMRNIPKSLDEAAFIDGASNLQTLFRIIIPLAVPIMGFIAVNAFMGPWLDYILPSVMMPSRDTVAVWLFRYMDPLSSTYSPIKFMTGALVIAVPIMIVQAFMQRYLVYGLTSGAEKG